MVGTHHLMMITIIPKTSSMIERMTSNAGHQGNEGVIKENNSRYEESNVISDKIKQHYLVLALSSKLFGNLAY